MSARTARRERRRTPDITSSHHSTTRQDAARSPLQAPHSGPPRYNNHPTQRSLRACSVRVRVCRRITLHFTSLHFTSLHCVTCVLCDMKRAALEESLITHRDTQELVVEKPLWRARHVLSSWRHLERRSPPNPVAEGLPRCCCPSCTRPSLTRPAKKRVCITCALRRILAAERSLLCVRSQRGHRR